MIPNIIAEKAVGTNKRRNIVANKNLNAIANKIVNTNKGQNAAVKQSILIKDQIIRRIKLRNWIGIEQIAK